LPRVQFVVVVGGEDYVFFRGQMRRKFDEARGKPLRCDDLHDFPRRRPEEVKHGGSVFGHNDGSAGQQSAQFLVGAFLGRHNFKLQIGKRLLDFRRVRQGPSGRRGTVIAFKATPGEVKFAP
jgi:hypothetical protein